MTDFMLGLSFAALPAVVFLVSTFADRLLQRFGRRHVFIAGNALVAVATALLGGAVQLPDGVAFVAFCLTMQAAHVDDKRSCACAPAERHAARLQDRRG